MKAERASYHAMNHIMKNPFLTFDEDVPDSDHVSLHVYVNVDKPNMLLRATFNDLYFTLLG